MVYLQGLKWPLHSRSELHSDLWRLSLMLQVPRSASGLFGTLTGSVFGGILGMLVADWDWGLTPTT